MSSCDVLFPRRQNSNPLAFQELMDMFKVLKNHPEFDKRPEYAKILDLCLSENKYMNSTSSTLLMFLHSKKTKDIDELMNIFQDMVISAKDITGILMCLIKMLEYKCQTTDEETCLKCLYSVTSTYHPLYLSVVSHPSSINTALTLLKENIKNDKLFNICLPFFYYVVHMTKNPAMQLEKSKVWKMIFASKKKNIILKFLMWFQVSDVSELEMLLFEPLEDLAFLYKSDVWILLMANTLCQMSRISVSSSDSFQYFKVKVIKSPIGIKSIVAIMLAQELYRGYSHNWNFIIQLIKDIIYSGDVWCEIMWIIIVGLVIGAKFIPMSIKEMNNLVKDVFVRSFSMKSICSFKYSQEIKFICARYPDLSAALDISVLFAEFRQDERSVMLWLKSLPSAMPISLPLKLVLCSLLVGGTYDIKVEALHILQKWGGNVRLYFYLLSIEINHDLVFQLLKGFCSCESDKNDSDLVSSTLQEMKSEGSNLLLLRYLFYNRQRFDTDWYDTLMFYLNTKGGNSDKFIIQKASFLRMIIIEGNNYDDKIYSSLIEMLQSYSELNDVAFTIVLDAFCILWDTDCLVNLNTVWGYLLKIAKSNTNLKVKKRFLSRVPCKQSGNTLMIMKSAYILWCYAVGSRGCEFAYTALKRFRLSNFNISFLPKSCASHRSSESGTLIEGTCWLHLVMCGKKKETGDLFCYLLKKEFKCGDPQLSASFYTSLWSFIRSSKCGNKNEIETTELCLHILSGEFMKGLSLKNLSNLLTFIQTSNSINVSKYAVRLLIRQAQYRETAKYLMDRIFKNELGKLYVLKEIFQALPEIESSCSREVFERVAKTGFKKIFSSDKKFFFMCLNGWSGTQSSIILKQTLEILSNKVSFHDERCLKIIKFFMKCNMNDVLKLISIDLRENQGEKLIYLYAEYGKRSQTIIFLRIILEYSIEFPRLKKLAVQKICEVLLHRVTELRKNVSDFAFDWLNHIWLPKLYEEKSACDYYFKVAIHSISTLSGNYTMGSCDYALNQFPRGCADLFANHSKKQIISDLLKYWKNNCKLCHKYRQACTLALMIIHDNVSKESNELFWNSVMCEC